MAIPLITMQRIQIIFSDDEKIIYTVIGHYLCYHLLKIFKIPDLLKNTQTHIQV